MLALPHRPHLPLIAALCACALGLHAQTPAKSFTLQEARTERLFGPYVLQDSTRVQVDGHAYQMRIVPPDRLSFISIASGRVYGPVQTIEGRLVELNRKMYAFSWHKATTATAPATTTTPRTPPLSQVPPPLPEPIPIPPLVDPAPPRPRTLLPEVGTAWHVTGWLAPLHETALRWKVDSKSGNDSDLSRTTIGAGVTWHGWLATLGFSPSVSGGALLPYGMDVTEAELDDGTGWSLALGYRRPFLRQGNWEASFGGRISISQDKLDLKSTTAIGQVSTNDTLDVIYESDTSSVKVTELALWLDAGITYTREWWGLFANLYLQPLNSIDVSGGLEMNGHKLSIDAERKHPLAFGIGGWVGASPLRGFADYTYGTESFLRIGVLYDF
ncbi:MAG: hypothetical protein GX174_10715 [Lentisphaerae bacterium]|jgi:hypothetical protein|nr:hypothetical protein [Lentisphaerota bacterium]